MKAKKDPGAVRLGRKGGQARAQALTPKQRSESAQLAGLASAKKRSDKERNELARSGGLVGGHARAQKLTAEQRSAIAKKAALARHHKESSKDGENAKGKS